MRHDNSSINLPNGSWLVLPRRIYAPAAIGARFVVLPLIAVAANVDWPHFWSLTTRKSSTTALVLSQTAGASTPLCLPFGVPMALVLARDGRSAVLMSHDLLDVLTLVDRVLVLETGQIIETVAGSVRGSPG
jgi:molybdate transport system permease protein